MGVSPACIDAVNAAGGGRLTRGEAEALIRRAEILRKRLEAEGKIDNLDARLRTAVAEHVTELRVKAALARKHAALNAIVRDKLETTVVGHVASGLSYRQAILAVLEGTAKAVEGGRKSVAATANGFESRYVGGIMAEIAKDRPHIQRLLDDEPLMGDVAHEMWELRPGGKPGLTGNDDAKFLAELFRRYSEMSRRDLNGLGAMIGKLDGWMPQTHDNLRVIRASENEWIAAIAPKLDMERSFPDLDAAERTNVLREIYTTIVTGRDRALTSAERGQRSGPANAARALGHERILHFKTADDFLAYNKQFGYGNVFTGMVRHQQKAAKYAAQMQVLGPNPGVMMDGLLSSLTRRLRDDTTMPAAQRRKQIAALQSAQSSAEGGRGGSIGSAWAIMTGLTNMPDSVSLAKIGSNVRAVESMAKLGGAVVSAIGDVVTSAANLTWQGVPLFKAYADILGGTLKGRGGGEQRQIAFLAGEGYDGLLGHVLSPYAAVDNIPGRMTKLTETFFRWSGLTWWTDTQRAVGARIMAAHMGTLAERGFDALPKSFHNVLSDHGIGGEMWDILRAAVWTAENGRKYVTPDRIADLPDAAFDPMVAADLEVVRSAAFKPRTSTRADGTVVAAQVDMEAARARVEKARVRLVERARLDTEITLRRFFADESGFGVLTTDAASQRFTTGGTRSGTPWGEAARLVMQFKGYPISFTKRVLGRALYGGRAGSRGQQVAHIGHLIVGLTIAGYMAQTAKNFLRGYEPSDPTRKATILAAFAQSGGAGIFGDFLFGQANRMGGGLGATIAGPGLGTLIDVADHAMDARDGDVRGGEWLNLALNNTPYLNLFYARPILEWLFITSLKESMSPGYVQRSDRRRRQDYGQERILPAMAF